MRNEHCLRICEALVILGCVSPGLILAAERPNVVLVMADDQGWGQTGYYDHPILETPNLDAMAASGLRFDRFYAAGPVCSPTRASVLTGRTHDRTGVLQHGYALHLQERTLPRAMQKAGYATGHFGKWHLNGVRGPGVPLLASDPYHPGRFGFDTWLTVSNFFDMNPVMGRMGKLEEFEITDEDVEEEIKVIAERAGRKPLAVRASLEAEKHLESLKNELLDRKVGEFLLENNTVNLVQAPAIEEPEAEAEEEEEKAEEKKPKAKKTAAKKKAPAKKTAKKAPAKSTTAKKKKD